jgi:hypothetical protein
MGDGRRLITQHFLHVAKDDDHTLHALLLIVHAALQPVNLYASTAGVACLCCVYVCACVCVCVCLCVCLCAHKCC